MTRVLTAYTNETDDVEAAVSEILSQLDLSRLLKFSAGIMYYYPDFAETGVTKQLSEKLPFPVVGGTTSNSAVRGSKEDITLTISVFTSDTIAFSVGISDPLSGEPFMLLEKFYKKLIEGKPADSDIAFGDKPAMLHLVVPNLFEITGDDYLAVFNSLSGGVPIFGAAAFTNMADFTNIKTFFNGVEYDDAAVVLAFWGDMAPHFFISDVPKEGVINQKAVITDSYRNRIKRINGIPALEYMESIGLAKNGTMYGMASCPVIINVPGGSRLVRTILSAENGELLCSGIVPSHLVMEIFICDRGFVMKSAQKTAIECRKWLESRDFTGAQMALVISCAARRWTLGSDVYAEIREIDKGLKDLPYHFVYTRGEFCPVHVGNSETVNFFYNFTLGICII